MKHFEIMGSLKEEGKNWRTNLTCHVVAESAQKAIQLAIGKHPAMEIWSLQHKGPVDLIEQVPSSETDYDAEGKRWMTPEEAETKCICGGDKTAPLSAVAIDQH